MTDPNPYVGPRPFTGDDERLFFGRTAELDRLVSLLYAHRLTVLMARSGVGKTSLLNAGLVPTLQSQEGFEVLPPTRVGGLETIETKPDNADNVFAMNAISAWIGADEPSDKDATLNSYISGRAHEIDQDGEPKPRVVVFDQFEEIFTAYPALWKKRTAFFEQLHSLLIEEPSVRVVLAIREDYLADLTSFLSVVGDLNPATMRLEPLDRRAATLAVTQPLKTTRREFQPEAATQLIEELTKVRIERAGRSYSAPGQHVEPVQLQVVCRALWQRLPQDVTVISTNDLEEFGDVDDALIRFYETSLATALKAGRTTERRLREWFETELITTAGTRGTVNRGTAETGHVPNAVVDALEDAHVVSGITRHGSRWYELTHDRFVEPIRESNRRFSSRRRRRRAWALGLVAAVGLVAFGVISSGSEPTPVAEPTAQLIVTASDAETEPGNFGDVDVGATQTQSGTVSNRGDAPSPALFTIEGGEAFSITANTCPAELEPGSNCDFSVAFAPVAAQSYSARLLINPMSETAGERVEIGLVGVGRGPSVVVSQNSISFSDVVLPGSNEAVLDVGNEGSADLTVVAVDVGTDAYRSESDCLGRLAPGFSCSIRILFEPNSVGSYTDSLVIRYGLLESTFVSLTGTATAAQASIGPSSLQFGHVRVGQDKTEAFMIQNSGTAPVVVAEVGLGSDNGAGFGVAPECPDPRLLPGDSCVVNVVFSPEIEGDSEGQVFVRTEDDLGRDVATEVISVNAAGVMPRIVVDPALLEWSECFSVCGFPRFSQQVTVVNEGTASPETFDISLAGSESFSESFIFAAEDKCWTLAAGDSCRIDVTYVGTSSAEEVGQLIITHDTIQSSVELRGTDIVIIP